MVQTTDYVARDRKTENNERILEAAFGILLAHGCAELSFSSVASAVGISRRPLIDRFNDLSDLKIKVWERKVGPAFLAWLNCICDAFDLEALRNQPKLFEEVFISALQPSLELYVALELLIESQFDGKLRNAINGDLDKNHEQWFNSDRAKSGRNGYIVMLMVGLLIAIRSLENDSRMDFSVIIRSIIDRALQERNPVELPPDTADYLKMPLQFDFDDKTIVSLLHSTHQIIGEVGYENTTVDAIVKRANSSQGALFARFPTKLDLFIESTKQHSELARKRNWEFRRKLDQKYGPGIGECIFIREACRPDWAKLRAVNIEQYRLTWYNATFRESSNSVTSRFKDERRQLLVRGFVHEDDVLRDTNDLYAAAVGMGMVFLPLIYPEASNLAFDVMLLSN